MLITFLKRHQLIATLRDRPALAVAELGVWRGEFSTFCLETLNPRSLTLIDAWSEESYSSPVDGGPQMEGFGERIRTYFSGDAAAAALVAAVLASDGPQASREAGGFATELATSPSDSPSHD